MHIGSEYFRRERRDDSVDSRQSADALRAETDERDGITRHSLLYRFFFRP